MNGYEDMYVYIYNSATRRMDSFSIMHSRSILNGNMDLECSTLEEIKSE